MKVVAITGSTGFLGRVLRKKFEDAGYRVFGLDRSPEGSLDQRFLLDESTELLLPSDLTVLIHCAHDFDAWSEEEQERINFRGSLRLLSALNKTKARSIFISSISAFEDCQSNYGKVKLNIERIWESAGGFIIRPGLIYSRETPMERHPGMFGVLARLMSSIARSPVRIVPVFDGGYQPFYLVEVTELAEAVLKISEVQNAQLLAAGIRQRCFTLANEVPVTFRSLLEKLAKKKLFFISFSTKLVVPVLQIFEGLRIRLPFTSDNLLGMICYPKNIEFDKNKKIGLNFTLF